MIFLLVTKAAKSGDLQNKQIERQIFFIQRHNYLILCRE